MASHNRITVKSVSPIRVSIWVNGMPVEVASNNRSSIIVSQNEARNAESSGFGIEKSVFAILFVGLSAFVVMAEMLDLVQAVKGNPYIFIKVLLAVVAGLGGGFAAKHSALSAKRKRK